MALLVGTDMTDGGGFHRDAIRREFEPEREPSAATALVDICNHHRVAIMASELTTGTATAAAFTFTHNTPCQLSGANVACHP